MQEVLIAAAREAERLGASRILRIRLRIGDLSGVVPEALSTAFDVLRAGTSAAQATLECIRVPAIALCDVCSARFPVEEIVSECPACGALTATLTGGRDLELSSLEIE